MISRRGFLSLLPAGVAGLTLDPERLLWRPGAKTIFLPSPRVVNYGSFVSYDDVTATLKHIAMPNLLWSAEQETAIFQMLKQRKLDQIPVITDLSMPRDQIRLETTRGHVTLVDICVSQ